MKPPVYSGGPMVFERMAVDGRTSPVAPQSIVGQLRPAINQRRRPVSFYNRWSV